MPSPRRTLATSSLLSGSSGPRIRSSASMTVICRPEPGECLSKLQPDRTTAYDDHGLWQLAHFEDVAIRPGFGIGEARNRGNRR